MDNNYKEYLESYAWKAIKKMKLEEQPDCECCGVSATTVHHLSYERRGSEREDDIVSICEKCHYECHHVNGYQIKNDEETLRKRFEEVKKNNLVLEKTNDYNFEIKSGELFKDGKQLDGYIFTYLGESILLFDDGEQLYYFDDNISCEYDGGYDAGYDEYEIERRMQEWGDGPENDGLDHPAFDGYDYDSYVYGISCESEYDSQEEYDYVQEQKKISADMKKRLLQVLEKKLVFFDGVNIGYYTGLKKGDIFVEGKYLHLGDNVFF